MTGTTDRDYLRGHDGLLAQHKTQPKPTDPAKAELWLVCLSLSRDCIPVRVFATEAEAREFVLDNPPYNPEDHPAEAGEALVHAAKVYDVEVRGSHVHGYEVFKLAGGVPQSRTIYFWPDSEGDPNWWPNAIHDYVI